MTRITEYASLHTARTEVGLVVCVFSPKETLSIFLAINTARLWKWPALGKVNRETGASAFPALIIVDGAVNSSGLYMTLSKILATYTDTGRQRIVLKIQQANSVTCSDKRVTKCQLESF